MSWKEKADFGLQKIEKINGFVVRFYSDRIAIQSWNDVAISWEQLQDVKNKALGSDAIAIEIFPVDSAVVNLRNTRHLWFSPEISDMVARCRHPEFGGEP